MKLSLPKLKKEDESKYIVFATGPAGTGKTMLAMLAGIKAFKENKTLKEGSIKALLDLFPTIQNPPIAIQVSFNGPNHDQI